MQEKIYFLDKRKTRLCGILSIPEETNSSIPAVIICHGFTTSKGSPTNTELEEVLNKHQIATLRFDFMGHGESEGKFEEITVSRASESIEEAIKLLKTKGFSKIGLIGSIFGGPACMITASKIHDLFALALKSPVSDYQEVEEKRRTIKERENWEKQGYIIHQNSKGEERKLNYTFYEDGEKHCAYDFAHLITTPTLIVHGESDESVPLTQSQKTAKLIPNCTLKTIPDANHHYSDESQFKEMIQSIAKFIINQNA